MIVDLPDTTTNDINKRITSLREEGGAITLGRVLTLVVAPYCEEILEDAIDAAVGAAANTTAESSWWSRSIGWPPRRGWTGSCGSAATPAR